MTSFCAYKLAWKSHLASTAAVQSITNRQNVQLGVKYNWVIQIRDLGLGIGDCRLGIGKEAGIGCNRLEYAGIGWNRLE